MHGNIRAQRCVGGMVMPSSISLLPLIEWGAMLDTVFRFALSIQMLSDKQTGGSSLFRKFLLLERVIALFTRL